MFDMTDINVNHFSDNETWIVSVGTLMDVNDSNEDWNQTSFDGADFNDEDNGKDRAVKFAEDLANYVGKSNQSKRAVVFLEGNEILCVG